MKPSKYRAEINGSFHDLFYETRDSAEKEAKKISKGSDIDVYFNQDWVAYNVYYSAIQKHGCNNEAAAEANSNGFNWTCDNQFMWYQAASDLS